MGVLSDITAALEVRQYDSPDDLIGLEREWSALWLRCPSATPFQSPAWLIPFWTHIGEGKLWVLTVRLKERLVGIAPFFVYVPKPGHERLLYLLGTGITDYLDVLLEPEFAPESFFALWNYLESNHHLWDVCDWQQLRSGSILLQDDAPANWSSSIHVQEVCPVLKLPDGVEELPGCVPVRMLEQLRYYRRRLQRLGAWSVQRATLENFEQLFNRFLELHHARWTSRGEAGALVDQQLQNFHRESAHRMLLSGTLRFYGLLLEGQIIAVLYGFACRACTYYYLGGVAPEYGAYSPGTLLIGHAIEEAIREGSTDFDFLRGREAYKYMWGARARLNYRRQMWFTPRAADRLHQPTYP